MAEKEITNGQLMAEVRSVKSMVINQGKILKKHDGEISGLLKQNELEEVAKQAVARYRKEELDKKNEQNASDFNQTKVKLLRDLAPFIVAGAALLYAVLTRHT